MGFLFGNNGVSCKGGGGGASLKSSEGGYGFSFNNSITMIRLAAILTLFPPQKTKPVVFAAVNHKRRRAPATNMSIGRELFVVTGTMPVCICPFA